MDTISEESGEDEENAGPTSEDMWDLMAASLTDDSDMITNIWNFDPLKITNSILDTLGLKELLGSPTNNTVAFLSRSSMSPSQKRRLFPPDSDSDEESSSFYQLDTEDANRTNSKSEHTDASGRYIYGSTLIQSTIPISLSQDHTWSSCDASTFNLRIGPSYMKNKQKAPSLPALYEPFAMDVIRTKQRLDHAMTRFTLPDTSHIDTHHPNIQPIFIVNLELSSESPSLWFSEEDGPGYCIIMYFMITEDTCNQLKDLETASPAIKLLAQFFEKATYDLETRARFKVICKCDNMDNMGFPSFINGYNAKPVLISGPKSGTAYVDTERRYFEMDIHTHMFPIVAKQCIQYILTRTSEMFMSIGFTIEGIQDDELPERIIACIAINKPVKERAQYLSDDEK